MKIYKLTSLVVIRSQDKRLLIMASGVTATAGWSNGKLVDDDQTPGDNVREYAFDATPPEGISLPVLMPISTSHVIDAENVNGVIVKSRTNSLEVHASEFQTTIPAPITTFAIGEEGPFPTTERLGEEDPPMSTLRLGEEGPPLTTQRFGEEFDPSRLLGETTPTQFSEVGPLGTDVRVDDPAAFAAGGGMTTLALGEEGGGGNDPRFLGRGNPFGGF